MLLPLTGNRHSDQSWISYLAPLMTKVPLARAKAYNSDYQAVENRGNTLQEFSCNDLRRLITTRCRRLVDSTSYPRHLF